LKMHTFPCRVLFSGARTHFFSCAFATTEAKNCQLGREQQVSWNLQLISSLNVLRQLNFYSSRRHLLHLLAPFPHRKACRWEEFGWRRIRISEWSNESWGCAFTESLLTAVPPFTHFHTRCKENTSWVEHWFWALHPVEVKLTFSSSPANRLFLYSSSRCAEFVWRRTVSWVCATNTRRRRSSCDSPFPSFMLVHSLCTDPCPHQPRVDVFVCGVFFEALLQLETSSIVLLVRVRSDEDGAGGEWKVREQLDRKHGNFGKHAYAFVGKGFIIRWETRLKRIVSKPQQVEWEKCL
jgi:hypothetical protein